jgi:hypothetical protein
MNKKDSSFGHCPTALSSHLSWFVKSFAILQKRQKEEKNKKEWICIAEYIQSHDWAEIPSFTPCGEDCFGFCDCFCLDVTARLFLFFNIPS